MADNTKIENEEWVTSLEWVINHESKDRVVELLQLLQQTAEENDIQLSGSQDAYFNTIPMEEETAYPGDIDVERKIEHAVRWNAMMMVVKANQLNEGIGGHISTFASEANLFEVALNHFLRGYDNGKPDIVFWQGHAAPGLYARSYVAHELPESALEHFRQELSDNHGISSYPHPRLMPDYWRFPTVSMGLAPVQAIYQARYIKYLENRGLLDKSDTKVWAFLGDGEMDEPESTGAISIASREKLNNLIFVINCNLQRLDGPVRGNGKVINELAKLFKGAGWKVLKVLWGSPWDKLFKNDSTGILSKTLSSAPDGELQKLASADGAYIREKFFGKHEQLAALVNDMSDQELEGLTRGGHDPLKIYNAYQVAVKNTQGPTVILAQTVKGYGQGESGEASNVTHKRKKLNEDELKAFRDRFNIELEDKKLKNLPFYRFNKNSREFQYLQQQRSNLQGTLPQRKVLAKSFKMPSARNFESFLKGSDKKEATTTGAFIQLLSKLTKDKNTKKCVIPIIPDESRTFGLDALFGNLGIYSPKGQNYEPVDKGNLLFYNEKKEGIIIEEGITEAGGISTFIAAGTNHISRDFYTIPFFIFYSMFGMQRIGDLIWAAADARARGFLIGGISGRTSLSGEGLQHQDGQSHLNAMAIPNLKAYDPAFAYELAVIIQNGMQRMYKENEDIFYYLTLSNATYAMPAMPKGVEEGIIQGLYRFKASRKRKNTSKKVHLLGSGAIMQEVILAAQILDEKFEIPSEIWSVTSYKELYDQARDTERTNIQGQKKEKNNIQKAFSHKDSICIAASDYVKAIPLSIAKWMPDQYYVLGTDGFGRSDTVEALRNFFEVDAKHIVWNALYALLWQKKLDKKVLQKFKKLFRIDQDKPNPADY